MGEFKISLENRGLAMRNLEILVKPKNSTYYIVNPFDGWKELLSNKIFLNSNFSIWTNSFFGMKSFFNKILYQGSTDAVFDSIKAGRKEG